MADIRIQVVIADPHPIVSTSLRVALEESGEFEVVAVVPDSDKLFFEALERTPDLVIMEIELPGRGSTAVAEQILTRLPSTKLAFFTSFDSDVYLDFAVKLGITGFILKTEPVETLVPGLRSVCNGDSFFSNSILNRLEYDAKSRKYGVKAYSYLSDLTLRQLQVLRHLVRGESVKEVAKVMKLSERAIESHKYRMMQKLGIHDRVELARFAIREGLMPA